MSWTGNIVLSVANYSIKDPFLFSDGGVDYLFYTFFSNAGGPYTADIGYAIKVNGSWSHQGVAISRSGSFGGSGIGIWAPCLIKVGSDYHAFVCGIYGGTYTLSRYKSSSPASGYVWQENLIFDHPDSGLMFSGAGEASNTSAGWSIEASFTVIVEFMLTIDSPDYSFNTLISSNENVLAINLRDSGTDESSLAVFNSNLSPVAMDSVSRIPHNEIHRVALVYGGGYLSLYVDGDIDASAAATGTLPNLSKIYVGRRSDADDKRYFNGSIFKVWLFNRALSPAEVKQQYIDDSVTSGLTNRYDFTLGSANDLVGNINLTVSGAVYGKVTGAKIQNLDADIIVYDNKYYMVSSGKRISLYVSADLLHWTFVKHLVKKTTSGWDSTLIEAPNILLIDGLFHIFYGGGDSSTIQKIGVVTSKNILGPYARVGVTGQIPLVSPVAVNPGPISHPFVFHGDTSTLFACVGTSVDGHNNQKIAIYRSQKKSVQNPGPLRRDLKVVSGSTYNDLIVRAPLGPNFQTIPEWTNESAVTMSSFVDTDKSRIGTKGVAIYSANQDTLNLSKIDRIVGN